MAETVAPRRWQVRQGAGFLLELRSREATPERHVEQGCYKPSDRTAGDFVQLGTILERVVERLGHTIERRAA